MNVRRTAALKAMGNSNHSIFHGFLFFTLKAEHPYSQAVTTGAERKEKHATTRRKHPEESGWKMGREI